MKTSPPTIPIKAGEGEGGEGAGSLIHLAHYSRALTSCPLLSSLLLGVEHQQRCK